MKRIFAIFLMISLFAAANSYAQTEEKKNKVTLTITDAGKQLSAELTSFNISISRYEDSDDEPIDIKPAKDTVKLKLPHNPVRRVDGISYLGLEAKAISTEMLKVIARRKGRFDGFITVVDPADNKVLKTVKFKQASLYSYSDQISAMSYGDSFGSVGLSINCKELTIDGVAF